MRHRLWHVTGLVLMLAGLLTGTAFAQAGDVARGRQLWETKLCKNCHGANGEGLYAAPRAGDGKSLADWIAQVRTPRSAMPAFSDAQVSDQDIADMYTYMQTLSAPASFTVKTFDTGANAPAGLVLAAQKRCTACHGDFTQTIQFRFVNQNRSVDTAAVIKQLRTPAQDMPHFSEAQVSDAQAGEIAAYLQTVAARLSAGAAGPATLPVSGGDDGAARAVSAALMALGAAMLGAGVMMTRLKRRA